MESTANEIENNNSDEINYFSSKISRSKFVM